MGAAMAAASCEGVRECDEDPLLSAAVTSGDGVALDELGLAREDAGEKAELVGGDVERAGSEAEDAD